MIHAAVLPQRSDERPDLLERALPVRTDLLCLLELGDFCQTVRKAYDRDHDLYVQAVEHEPRDKSACLKLIDLCNRMSRADEAKEWSRRLKQRSGAV